MNKKIFKRVGNILMLLAIGFLTYRISKLNVDYKIIFRDNNIFEIFILSVLYGIHTYLVCVSWRKIVSILTNKRISFVNSTYVWNKSNLMKYIPGNVFQYIGRNELAVVEKVGHAEVALGTVIDVFFNLAGVFLVACVSYSSGIKIGVEYIFGNKKFLLLLVGIAIVIVLILYLCRRKIKGFIDKIKLLLVPKNILSVLMLVIFYAFWAVYTGLIYIFVLPNVLDYDLTSAEVPVILGAFLLSWIIGFIMPGAPGGIGVREAVFTLLLSAYGSYDEEIMLLAIVLYRFINIIGDVVGLIFAFITKKITERTHIVVKEEKNEC